MDDRLQLYYREPDSRNSPNITQRTDLPIKFG